MIDLKPSQLPRLRAGSWVALDTETSGLYPDDGARVASVSVAWFTADEVEPSGLPSDDGVTGVAFPFAHGIENQPWFGGAFALFGGDDGLNLPGSEWDALNDWLIGKRIVMHNGQYDLIMMDAGLPEWAPAGPRSLVLDHLVQWDTMLGCKNLWPVHPKGLGPTADRLKLGKKLGDPVKDWIRKNKAKYVKQGYPSWGSGYDLVPWMLMGEYAAVDAVLTLKVWRKQQAEFLDGFGDWTEFVTKQMPLMKQFVRMERRGMPYPREKSLGYVGVLEAKQAKVARELPFTANKEAALKFFFSDETTRKGVAGLDLTPVNVGKATKAWPQGAPTLDAEVLGDMARDNVMGAQSWKLYTDLGRLASMYYGGYAEKCGEDGRLRARIRQIREETKTSDGMADRLSIERVNLQAMPHDGKLKAALEGLDMPSVRNLIASEVEENFPGWDLWELDLSQAELRVGALLSNCKPMLRAFTEGRDLHQDTADLIHAPRKTAKMSNFLLLFDGGWMTFMRQVKRQTGGDVILTPGEAKKIVFPWKRAYPQYKKMADIWEKFVQQHGFVPLANGQLRWFTARERQWDARKGWNQRVQGSIQQLFQEWLLEAEAICNRHGVQLRADGEGIGGAGVLMTVHDSIILLLPRDLAEVIVKEIQATAVRLWDEMFPGVPGAVDAKTFG
ncbi:DNA polymerase I [Streptomyces phage Araceli]|nr:DNA polymerase I [Streptomyces phage Henoccus]AWY07379.1 DNA polymerase I [Streptomyces phage JackieB]QFG07874.1 DNA polymerase I [Streptomyces phage Araceli]